MWRIEPLLCGLINGVSQAEVTYGEGFADVIALPIFAYLLRGPHGTILVDAGAEPPERLAHSMPAPIDHSNGCTLLEQLAKRHVSVGDIDAVIATHLHWDHIGGCAFLPDVPVYVQRKELAFASAPLPTQLLQYHSTLLGLDPYWSHLGSRLRLIEGAQTLFAGVDVIETPGHTDGHQSVLVQTDAGQFCITGDLVDSFRNWTGRRRLWPEWIQGIPPGNLSNVADWYASAARIRSLDCRILPAHDITMKDAGPFGVISD